VNGEEGRRFCVWVDAERVAIRRVSDVYCVCSWIERR